ncbi:preprotein translocase subunit SecD [Allocoleopsis sp.]|uniref:preprotein translocase subunit SecD n=1 Tax=Allocoleopsis sp. TaxID=3088169 RepID=UPI002FD10044
MDKRYDSILLAMSNPKQQLSLTTVLVKLIGFPLTLVLVFTGCGLQKLVGQPISDRAHCPFNGMELTLQIQPPTKASGITPELSDAVKNILKQRISGLGIRGAAIQTINQEQLLIQLPDEKDAQQAERVLGGIGELDFRQQKSGTETQLPIELQVREGLLQKQNELRKTGDAKALAENQQALDRSQEAIANLFERTDLSGKNLKDSNPQPTPDSSRWEITLRFDDIGEKAFAQLTKDLAGTGRAIGVFLDNSLISSPVVGQEYAQTGITGGSAVITGNFTLQSAQELAIQLRSGALPAPLKVLSNRRVNNNRCP